GAGMTAIASPLLVAYPAVHALNFARLSPYVDRTINHLRHVVDAFEYSLIGGGFGSRVGDGPGRERAAQSLMSGASKGFPKLKDASLRAINWGIKTEWGKERGTRNYRSVIRGVAPHVLAVLPGKFSLCFSLAERVAAHLGIRVAGVPPSFPGHVARATVD